MVMFHCYVNVYQLGYSKLGNILESTNYECILGDGPGRTGIAACKFVSILPIVSETWATQKMFTKIAVFHIITLWLFNIAMV